MATATATATTAEASKAKASGVGGMGWARLAEIGGEPAVEETWALGVVVGGGDGGSGDRWVSHIRAAVQLQRNPSGIPFWAAMVRTEETDLMVMGTSPTREVAQRRAERLLMRLNGRVPKADRGEMVHAAANGARGGGA